MRKRKRTRWLFYIPFWLLIVASFGGLAAMQFSRYYGYRQELDRLIAAIEEEAQIALDIAHRQAFFASDAYIEQAAREQLGFIMPDEFVFVNIAG